MLQDVLAVLLADSAEAGLTVADIFGRLKAKHDEREIQRALDMLIEQQAVFNTFSHERYAAV